MYICPFANFRESINCSLLALRQESTHLQLCFCRQADHLLRRSCSALDTEQYQKSNSRPSSKDLNAEKEKCSHEYVWEAQLCLCEYHKGAWKRITWLCVRTNLDGRGGRTSVVYEIIHTSNYALTSLLPFSSPSGWIQIFNSFLTV